VDDFMACRTKRPNKTVTKPKQMRATTISRSLGLMIVCLLRHFTYLPPELYVESYSSNNNNKLNTKAEQNTE